jgi:hypothetical protein
MSDCENAALNAAFLRCNNAFRRPLLTGNGISAGFSVLVPVDEASEPRGLRAPQKFKRESTCTN